MDHPLIQWPPPTTYLFNVAGRGPGGRGGRGGGRRGGRGGGRGGGGGGGEVVGSLGKAFGRKRFRRDRYYGRFRCKICCRTWESSRVYTKAGTKKVLAKQGCKRCVGPYSWCFPEDMELLKCRTCQNPSKDCRCVCDFCGHLWYRPRGNKVQLPDDQYCHCHSQNFKRFPVGTKINSRKVHLPELCGICVNGWPCGADDDEETDDDDEDDDDDGGVGMTVAQVSQEWSFNLITPLTDRRPMTDTAGQWNGLCPDYG